MLPLNRTVAAQEGDSMRLIQQPVVDVKKGYLQTTYGTTYRAWINLVADEASLDEQVALIDFGLLDSLCQEIKNEKVGRGRVSLSFQTNPPRNNQYAAHSTWSL